MTVAEPVAEGEALDAGALALGAGVPGEEVVLCGVVPPVPDPPPEHAAARMATVAMAQQAAPRRATELTGLMLIVSLGWPPPGRPASIGRPQANVVRDSEYRISA
ncbi:MAG: hypothetical protein ACYCVZ_18330 [Streptosporangiaceae bacterium]